MATDVAYGGDRHLDVTQPFPANLAQADVVTATNVLHCVADPASAVAHMASAARPGGWVVIGEGAPEPSAGVPWALNLLFGPFAGWFDRGGFRPADTWAAALDEAGLESVADHPWHGRELCFGGVWIGRRPR